MATKTTTKSTGARARKRANEKLSAKDHLKKAQPALLDLGGAVGGGVLGALLPPAASGIGGVALLVTGACTQKSWITSSGAAMIVTTVTTGGGNHRTAPGGKTDLKTEMHNGKERVKSFLSAFGGKFSFWKKKPEPPEEPGLEDLDGLGRLDHAHFAALDQLNRDLMAQGYELASTTVIDTAYPMIYPSRMI